MVFPQASGPSVQSRPLPWKHHNLESQEHELKKALIAALVAALSITAVVGVSAASGDSHSLNAAKSQGKRGKRGPRGLPGPAGPAGPAGVASVIRVTASPTYQGGWGSGSEVQTSTATCPAGTFVTGGGFKSQSIDNIVAFQISSPTQYSVISVNEYSSASSIAAHAICGAGPGLVASGVRSKKTPKAVEAKAELLQEQVDTKRK